MIKKKSLNLNLGTLTAWNVLLIETSFGGLLWDILALLDAGMLF